MIEIPLTKGLVAIVDDDDGDLLNYNWFAYKKRNRTVYYAARNVAGQVRDQDTVLMHRVVLAAPSNAQVDHIDGDGLNNRKSNLRLATHSQNLYNQGLRSDNLSGFKGVSLSGGRWHAQIQKDKKKRHLGYFATPEDAARAYDVAARDVFGEFARCNFPL